MENADPDNVELEIEVEPDAKDGPAPDVESDPATEAFTRLEREMALMRRAVEHLAAERADIVIPDYGATLVKMTGNLDALDASLRQIGQMPALLVTPEDFGQRITSAARSARASDESMIQQWKSAAYGHERALSETLASAVTRTEQRRREIWAVGAGAAIAMLLMSFLPGIIARELPSSWQLPERMARRTLDEPTIMDAGIRLIQSANPQAWEDIAQAAQILDANREAIKRCKDAARRSKRPTNCQVRVQ